MNDTTTPKAAPQFGNARARHLSFARANSDYNRESDQSTA